MVKKSTKKKNKTLKRKNNKKILAFTLVELLAVIVILAIIMIIAIPSVLNTLETARKKSFIEYADKVVQEAVKKYLSDELNGNTTGTCVVYSIKNDLDLSSTGNYDGYVLVKSDGNENEYYVTLSDDNYFISALKYDNDFNIEKIENYNESTDKDLFTIGELALEAECDSFSQINLETNESETVNTKDIVDAVLILGKFELSDTNYWEIGNILTTDGSLVDNTQIIRTKELIRAKKKEYLIEKLTQISQKDFYINIYEYDKDNKYLGYQQFKNSEYGQKILELKKDTKFVRFTTEYHYKDASYPIGYLKERRMEIHVNFINYMEESKFKSPTLITDFNLGEVGYLIEGCYCKYGYCHNTAKALYDIVLEVEGGASYTARMEKNPRGGYSLSFVELDENHNYIGIQNSLLAGLDEGYSGAHFTFDKNTKYVIAYIGSDWYSSQTWLNNFYNDFAVSQITFTKD